MSWWRELVVDNPMMIEMKMFQRKFFGANAIANTLAIGVIAILLALLIGLLYVYEIPYEGPAIAALVVVTIAAPIFLHGSIAGERERRSWEMLMVAPITNAQIVVGKFAGGAIATVTIVGAFSLAILIAFYPRFDRAITGPIIVLMVLSFAMLISAFTMLVSSWSKRSITTISVVYGSLFFALIVLPALIVSSSSHADEIAFYLNPFYAVTQVNQERFDSYYYYSTGAAPQNVDVNSYMVYGVMHIFIYLTLAALCLWWATTSLSSGGIEEPMKSREGN